MDAPLVLLVGIGRLASAIDRRLRACGAQVERMTADPDDPDAFASAPLATASALVLAADDDAGNLDLALAARRVQPGLRLVVRLFDAELEAYVRDNLVATAVLSMSGVAAPTFTERTLASIGETAAARTRASPRPVTARSSCLRRRLDRVLIGALASLAGVVIAAAAYFVHALRLPFVDALYFVWTTVMTVGYGDISLRDASTGTKLVGMALMFAGAAFMAVLFAILTGWVVTRRLAVLQGRVQVGWRGHVIVAGGGNLGTRVSGLLAAAGRRVVVVERDEGGRNVEALRAAGHHVIIADATRGEILSLAGVARAGALLALTDSDAANLQIAILARAHGGGAIPIVMRSDSSELSRHMTAHQHAVGLSPTAIAADQFAAAALEAPRAATSQPTV